MLWFGVATFVNNQNSPHIAMSFETNPAVGGKDEVKCDGGSDRDNEGDSDEADELAVDKVDGVNEGDSDGVDENGSGGWG